MAGLVALEVDGLRVELSASGHDITDGISFHVRRGSILGLVGESGCGKTAVAMALLNHARPGTRIASGRVLLDGADILTLDGSALRRVRGNRVSYVPQDPGRRLNPRHRVIRQLDEVLRVHNRDPQTEREHRALLLEAVDLPSADSFLRRYPHELSGGQQQRITLVMALLCRPDVIVLDEPTTGLDVTTQLRVLEAIERLRDISGSAFVHITHDLAVVARLADQIGVMYAGRLVEFGATQRVLHTPAHPYTARLLASTPRMRDGKRPLGMEGMAPPPGRRPSGCSFAPRCPLAEAACSLEFPPVTRLAVDHDVRCFRWAETGSLSHSSWDPEHEENIPSGGDDLLAINHISATYGRGEQLVQAVRDVSFAVLRGECLALVGESGSGKSTLARCIAGLHRPSAGSISLNGEPLEPDVRERPDEHRRTIRLVYQNPDRSLNPRRTVGYQIARPIELFKLARGAAVDREVANLLARVRLPSSVASRLPAELSGGEKQRVAIARALASRPTLLLCDEVTSSLDVSVQAAVLELLAELRHEHQLSMLYISHDLAVVATIADRIVVLRDGVVRELGDTKHIIHRSEDDYTRELTAATLELPTAQSG